METIKLKDGTERESLFSKDNFTSRRTTGLNMYDPNSLLTGTEISKGLGYENPRVYDNYSFYRGACLGWYTTDEIVEFAPRYKG